MDLIRKTYQASETKAVDGEERTLIVRITTSNPDRSQDVVIPAGMQADNYLRNPVVAAFHRYDKPGIGKTLEIQKTDDGVVAKVQFTPKGVNPEADQLYELYKGGFMNAWSIGFMPKKWSDRPGGGREFQEWELLEYSAVLVPANPNALTLLRSKGLDPDKILKEQEEAIKVKENKSVIPYKETPKASEDAEWDAGREVKEADVEDLKIMCAWYDSENPNIKSSYKLPHHKAGGEHPVVWRGVAAAMAALLGARGGVDIPDKDRKGVYNHLAKHYKQFEKEPPEFKNYSLEALLELDAKGIIDFGHRELEKKEGRVLSEKNRKLISEAIAQMKAAIVALDELLAATEPSKDDKKNQELVLPLVEALKLADKTIGMALRDYKGKGQLGKVPDKTRLPVVTGMKGGDK